MITLKVSGTLAKDAGFESMRLDAKDAPEAMFAANINVGGKLFAALRRAQQNGVDFYLARNGQFLKLGDEHVFDLPFTGDGTFEIVPVLRGAGRGGLLIAIGVVLIVAVSIMTGGAAAALVGGAGSSSVIGAGATGFSLLAAQAAVNLGIGLVLAGLASFFIKPPKASASEDKTNPSYIFNGPVNTTRQGHPVPVLYGMLRVGGAIVSARLLSEQESIYFLENMEARPSKPIGGGEDSAVIDLLPPGVNVGDGNFWTAPLIPPVNPVYLDMDPT